METSNEVLVATEVAEETQVGNESTAVIDFKMVTFSLAEKDYSIDIMHVKEIARAGRFTYVPNTLPFVLGVYNLRGEIIPILDLRLFFNIEVPPRDENKLENMLILQVDDQRFGVVVDKIDKVIGVQKSTIQPPHPLFGDINIKYIDGIVESNKRLYVLLDITKIFTSKDIVEGQEKLSISYKAQSMTQALPVNSTAASAPVNSEAVKKTAPVKAAAPVADVADNYKDNVKFLKESLQTYKKFTISQVNESWVRHRYQEWTKLKGDGKALIQNADDADEFLKPLWSTNNEAWWTKS